MSDETIEHLRQRLSEVEAERDEAVAEADRKHDLWFAEVKRLQSALDEYASVCACGCPVGDHENHGEDGWHCENDYHDCIRTSKAVATILASLRQSADAGVALRADQERMREALQPIQERITDYLMKGGFINPEHMEHQKVSELLLDIRAALSTPRQP